jgi:tellurite resistance protein TehA-like permease
MKKIENIRQLESLTAETYIQAAIIAVAALVVALLIARTIKWKGGKIDRSHRKRRFAFIATGIIAALAFFLYNYFYVSEFISKAPLRDRFLQANIFATLLILAVYFAAGISSMLAFRRSKWGSIMGKSKR